MSIINNSMRFKLWLEMIDVNKVPPEPGTIPIPANHARLYHYFNVPQNKDQEVDVDIRKNGIDITRAKGSSYGEPNVVWASFQVPDHKKIFAEFGIAMDDPRWLVGKPQNSNDLKRMTSNGSDVYFRDSIKPNEILAIHHPWHGRYRYIVSHPKILQQVVSGEFDYLMDYDPVWSNVVRSNTMDSEYGPAILQVKKEFEKSGH